MIFIEVLIINILSFSLAKCAINWNGNNWVFGCDFKGNDLSDVRIPGEQCGGKCAQAHRCTHFTWTTWNGGTCWMKKGSVSKNDAFATNERSMVCDVLIGISPPNERITSSNGKTTRYWDCYKPSRSWPEKVSGKNTHVKAFHRNGYNIHYNANIGSESVGGKAFTCKNQQPWAVNDQLAYGFAAITIPGLNEQQRWCACYRLDFTSGPVQGKTMIVQITNSGDDVHPGQFDLQIPGGGIGIFNGCTRQWNAPSDGWGKRYGGVFSHQACDQLSEAIRAGCHFRFDWFCGADNPTMTYSRIQCPHELVAITGCSRGD